MRSRVQRLALGVATPRSGLERLKQFEASSKSGSVRSSLRFGPPPSGWASARITSISWSNAEESGMPWERLLALIEPFYPKGGNSEGGLPPVPLEPMVPDLPVQTLVQFA